MMIPNHSTQDDYEYHNAIGVTQYGQMTAGSYMYIGPQGIVHGTTITLMNAARMYWARPQKTIWAASYSSHLDWAACRGPRQRLL